MRVALMNSGKTIQLLGITNDGQAIDGMTVQLSKGQRIGAASFEQLKNKIDGEYELLISDNQFHVMKSEKQNKPMRWWQLLAIGIFMLVVGSISYIWFYITEELGGESMRAHIVIVLLYSYFGKEGIAGFFLVVGVISILLALARTGMLTWQPIDNINLAKKNKTLLVRGILIQGSQEKDFLAPVISETGGWVLLDHQINTDSMHLQPVEVRAKLDKSNHPPHLLVSAIRPLKAVDTIWK